MPFFFLYPAFRIQELLDNNVYLGCAQEDHSLIAESSLYYDLKSQMMIEGIGQISSEQSHVLVKRSPGSRVELEAVI